MRYVGVVLTEGKTIQKRFKQHCEPKGTGSGAPYLHAAIQKHGREWFHTEQIDEGSTPEQAAKLERRWIKDLGTKAPNGYNITEGGIGNKGAERTAEWRANLSKSGRCRNFSPEHCQHLSESHQGAKNHRFGKSPSNEVRQRMSESLKQAYKDNPRSAECRAKLSAALMGHKPTRTGPHSPETIERLRTAALARWAKRKSC